MARIVYGAALSHSPLLVMAGETWAERARQDTQNDKLNLSDGRKISYAQLLAEVGPRYAEIATEAEFVRIAALCEKALDRLSEDLIASRPDVVLLIGDDHEELFRPENQPALSVFYGEDVVTQKAPVSDATPDWIRKVFAGFAMDRPHHMPGHPDLALHIIYGLVDREVDVAVASRVADPLVAGLGHSVGFVAKRMFQGQAIPLVPFLVNTYYPPNVPTSARCHDIGRKLAEAITQFPAELRVAVIASGGLSHFVTDEGLDCQVIDGLRPGKSDLLRTIPREALQEGSSEILCWIMLAGALEGLTLDWVDYQPIYRTPAGTGIGMGFASWSEERAVSDLSAQTVAVEPVK